ncbi:MULTISPECIES: aminotransferase class I/II-fold pyridoxal phosphate-dependent enzyme [unclassified Streptomyces]|uniref:aminotransferase class I/II-fold pyridoxal phosphate-dependent enzyme n=1 Tax=unclassified Streptomyces TaxID=2593676 RepID=UPI0018E9211C|nr:aminotransferase class I/II-fold pyridoxal phosphate-dependent enzyme [Streptomyces sp. TSRI0281]
MNLTGSDTEGLSLDELWEVAPADTRRWYESLTLGYTESPGHPLLRELAAQSSGLPSGSAVQVFAGATEAVFVLLNTILSPKDHVVVIGPTYQLLIDVPRAIGRRCPRSASGGRTVGAWTWTRSGAPCGRIPG